MPVRLIATVAVPRNESRCSRARRALPVRHEGAVPSVLFSCVCAFHVHVWELALRRSRCGRAGVSGIWHRGQGQARGREAYATGREGLRSFRPLWVAVWQRDALRRLQRSTASWLRGELSYERRSSCDGGRSTTVGVLIGVWLGYF